MEIKKDFFDLKTGTKFRSEKGGRAYIVLGREYADKIEACPLRWTLDIMTGRRFPGSFGKVWIDDGKPEPKTSPKVVLLKKGGAVL